MSGISILRNLLLKEAVKGSGQASGIMSIGDSVRKLAEKRLQSYLLSAQKQGVDLDKLGEQEIKYMLELNKKPNYRVISQDDPEFVSFRDQILGKKNRDNVIQGKFGKPFKEEIGSVDNIINNITRMEPVAALKEVNNVLRREGKYKNLSKQDSEKVFNDTNDWINQRDQSDLYDYKNKRPFREDPNFDPDDPDFDPENFADGGRTGYYLGSMVGRARQQKDGIESRLEKLGGDVTSAEQMLQGINKRLETAGSSVPEGSGASIANYTPQLPVDFKYGEGPAGGLGTLGPAKIDNQGIGNQHPGFANLESAMQPNMSRPAFFDTAQPVKHDNQLNVSANYGSGELIPALPINSQQNLQNALPGLFADGGVAGMLGERTGFDIGGGIFSSTPDTSVKFNLDGETIFLNPDFFEAFMGPYMNDPEKFKRRTDDLKQEIRRNQSTVALADGGVAGLLGERPGYDEGKEVINYDKDANYRGWKKLYEVNPDIAAMNENHSKYEQYYKSKQNSKALGGRVPFAMGRRAFLKLLGVGGAGIAGLKTGVGLGGKKVATEVAKDVATTSGPPPYFFNLVNKIKTLGDDTLASKDKAIAKKYKDYTMEEDFAGNIEIIKKGGDDMFPEDVYMSYKVDEVPLKGRGKKGSTKVEEYEEYTARPDIDGKMKDVEGGVPDSVVQEGTMFEDDITDFATKKLRKRKAGGGVAYMLGQ